MNYDLQWLKTRFDKGDTIKYIFFWGHTNKSNVDVEKFVFSQWYPSHFLVDGVEYRTTEHWMMAHKAKLFGDDDAYRRILKAEKPAEVKEIGRQIIGFDDEVWKAKRFEIVKAGNIHKFSQNGKLKNFLLATGDRVIVEASPTDNIWGVGLAEDSKFINNPHTWKGLNLLGFALMEARDVIRQSWNG
jgi:ribA/ribD-fused uncharacterized protein